MVGVSPNPACLLGGVVNPVMEKETFQFADGAGPSRASCGWGFLDWKGIFRINLLISR
jgi:hypothetical protein